MNLAEAKKYAQIAALLSSTQYNSLSGKIFAKFRKTLTNARDSLSGNLFSVVSQLSVLEKGDDQYVLGYTIATSYAQSQYIITIIKHALSDIYENAIKLDLSETRLKYFIYCNEFDRNEAISVLKQFEDKTPRLEAFCLRVLVIELLIREIAENLDLPLNKYESPQIKYSITFPPEYHQAGLGILNYFSTYLREQYPDDEATVVIEQQGLNVRLIITSKSGQTEIIEKALHEYKLIITGQAPPETFTQNDKLLLELKNELRVAQFRIEAQHDIISLQNARIDKLLNIVGEGISSKQAINIDFKPSITATNSVNINHNISLALGGICELKDLLPNTSDAYRALGDLENSLESIEKENNPDIVRKSSAMSKFRRILDKFTEEGSTLKKAIDATETGWELMKDLAGKYNKVAEWCGLPQVPSVFI